MSEVNQINASETPKEVLDAADAQTTFHLGNFMVTNGNTSSVFQADVSVNVIVFWSRYASGSVTVTEAGQEPVTLAFSPNQNVSFSPKTSNSAIQWSVTLDSSFGYASVHCNKA